jgi:hypothetical protein
MGSYKWRAVHVAYIRVLMQGVRAALALIYSVNHKGAVTCIPRQQPIKGLLVGEEHAFLSP